MKKIAVITITVGTNYGNKLQNYALCKFLNNMGFHTETVPDNVELPMSKKNFKYYIRMIYYIIFKKKYIEIIHKHRNKKNLQLRYAKFEAFTKKHIPQSNFNIDGISFAEEMTEHYDYFICGSDQIWNPNFHTTNEIMFLNFAPKEKSIAYSASLGVTYLPEDKEKQYGEYLKKFKAISMREQAGVDIVKKISGCEAELLIDPTMLLDAEQWKSISHKPERYNGNPYIFTYFLGGLQKEIQNQIKKIAKERQYEIIELVGENELRIKDSYYFSAAPDEFVWLIEHSEIVFTDSFHASVFSIIMKRPFVVCERIDSVHSMSSRIDTLLKTFSLENRRYEQIDKNDFFDIDYSNINEIFTNERKKSKEFLERALEED